MIRTASEQLFEIFCAHHKLDCHRIPEGPTKTPDYYLELGSTRVAMEIEQIESMCGFTPGGVSSRTVGWHVRQKISEARAQVQVAAHAGIPAVLLIYNTVDPLQLFGTEQHDFLSAMYGELTVIIDKSSRKASQPFHGRNARLREDANTSFSGVGHLQRTKSGAAITIYENVFASLPLPFSTIPDCIDVIRVEIEHAA